MNKFKALTNCKQEIAPTVADFILHSAKPLPPISRETIPQIVEVLHEAGLIYHFDDDLYDIDWGAPLIQVNRYGILIALMHTHNADLLFSEAVRLTNGVQ